jgi:hypothetical protein
MNAIGAINLVIREHNLTNDRVNRTAWLIDEAVRAGKGSPDRPAAPGRHWLLLTVLLLALIAALGAAEVAEARGVIISGPATNRPKGVIGQ